MTLHLLKKVVLGVAMLLFETSISYSQNTEQELNIKYWTMRERFRKYFVSIGKAPGQSIPVSKRQSNALSGGNRCGGIYSNSDGWMSWGDATGYLGDYMATLATEYALLSQENKNTTATLNELYYAINAMDRLDGFAEPVFSNNNLAPDYNGFFIRDDVDQTTLSYWNQEYINTGGYDSKLNYQCLNSDHEGNLDGSVVGNSKTNEPSFDQIVTIFQGFKFIQKYVPNVYVKPTNNDVGFFIIQKTKEIASRIMDYASGSDRHLKFQDHSTEYLYSVLNPGTNLLLGAGGSALLAMGQCADGDVRSNWVLTNLVTDRKVGVESSDTKGQDIRPFAWPLAKIGEQITGNTYMDRDVHHEVIDKPGDGIFCLELHDYHMPLIFNKTHVWDAYEAGPHLDDDFVLMYYDQILFQKKPVCFKITKRDIAITPFKTINRNSYLLEAMGAISGTWSHTNVNKFANYYGHENFDLIYSCLHDETPQNSQQHYIDLLNKLTCDGPHNFGPSDFTSFWNNGNSFEHPTYDDIDTESYNYGEYNANDWMWLYNMYRLKFGDSSFPSYDDQSCNCKKSPVIEQNYDQNTFELTNSITINRVFPNYLKLGISLKEYSTQILRINNKNLTNKTELVICEGDVSVENNGLLENANSSISDSVKILVNSGSSISLNNNSTLNVGNYTKVIFNEGSFMNVYDPNSKIVVGVGAQLIVKKNSLLKLHNGGKIVVKNNAKLIIEPGAFFELNNSSKLIVEDGGQVIIQANLSNVNATINGLLTYNQGAIIQLNGNNAVLEINGRLHIGDNATFGFTYPGSNSGYIKFNRGTAWWDNGAPNNAHITCGTNARISLQGQSKTDKIIDISQINVAIPKNLTQFIMVKGLVELNNYEARLETDRPTIISNSTFISSSSPYGGRGLLVFGQPTCLITNCDFKKLRYGIVGALFYSGTKLGGVKNCNFENCGYSAIVTYGGGASLISNNFINNKEAITCLDVTSNSLVSKNTIDFNSSALSIIQPMGIDVRGPGVEFEVKQNDIHNQYWAIAGVNANLKLRCNDLQNNSVALVSNENSKVNMSDLLGGGYNNASNCELAAKFIEAGIFEAEQGFNNFQIINSGPCIEYPQSGHGPNITPAYTVCPTIMEGSLINFTSQNTQGIYEIFAEQNFWRPLISPTDAVEDRQNKVRKIDLTDLNNPIIDSGSIVTGNVLADYSNITCPGSGGGGTGDDHHKKDHPLDDNSNSSIITTASFYNKKLQKALQFSLTKIDKLENSSKVNQAANLFTEVLKYNYITPVKNTVDKYLLELAYQKLFTCVAQLAEWHRDSAITFNPMPANLQVRFNDLHTICALRAGRKDITEKDYKEISDLILLDKAMLYRISDNYQSALSLVNTIIAGAPKATHLNMYESFRCFWSTERDAINGSITLDEALSQLNSCHEMYRTVSELPAGIVARKADPKKESEVIYADDYAIAVYPNPTSGQLSVAYSLSEFKNIKLEIYNAQGKMMKFYNLNPEERTINIDYLNLENGIYFYNITGDEKIIMSKKLVIIK
jgi:hypothetical protein